MSLKSTFVDILDIDSRRYYLSCRDDLRFYRTRTMTDGRLPDAEMEVLATLAQLGEATARQLREALEPSRPMAHASVMTLLGRLEAKGLVARRKADSGKAFVYTPLPRARGALSPAVRRLAERVFGGSAAALVASLFETRPPTAAELDDLQALLDGMRRAEAERQ
jgi:predicted transcriptional regulator